MTRISGSTQTTLIDPMLSIRCQLSYKPQLISIVSRLAAINWLQPNGRPTALAHMGERVARYFFNIHNGISRTDTIGSEHPDVASVRAEAVESAGELLRGRLLTEGDVSALLMHVTDQSGATVLVLSVSAAVQIVIPPSPLTAEADFLLKEQTGN
jgi:hypothetical protein